MNAYAQAGVRIARELPEYDQMFQITGVPTVNQGIGGVLFKPWERRKQEAPRNCSRSCRKWSGIAGASLRCFQFPPLPGSQGLPMQVVIKTHRAVSRISTRSRRRCLRRRRPAAMFFYVDTDLKLDKPQTTVDVDRDLVATLGLTQQDVGGAGRALGGCIHL